MTTLRDQIKRDIADFFADYDSYREINIDQDILLEEIMESINELTSDIIGFVKK